MQRDSPQSLGVPFQKLLSMSCSSTRCVHADQVSGCSTFVFFQSFQEPSRYFVIQLVVGRTSILSVAEEFGGSEVSFDKLKHPQLLAEMEERQNNLREPVYTEEIQWLSIFSFLKCKVFSVHVPFSPDSLLFVTVFLNYIQTCVLDTYISLACNDIVVYIKSIFFLYCNDTLFVSTSNQICMSILDCIFYCM